MNGFESIKMKKARNIFRIVFFLLAIVLLVYLNSKAEDNTETIVEFKIKMIEKIRTDSLNAKHKLDLLVNETTKFMDHSTNVKKGINYLIQLLVLFVVSELFFLILKKKNDSRKEII